MDGYDNHNPLEVLDEDVKVVPERNHHHTQEYHDREVLQGLVERLGYLGGIVCGEHAECQGHAEQQEDGDEDIPYGYLEHLQGIGRMAVEVAHVEASPDGEVGRCGKDSCCVVTADIDTESSRLPLEMAVMKFDTLPPGHEPTKIIPIATIGVMCLWKMTIRRKVMAGMIIH